MMDGIKEYMKPKRFSILSYICVVIHFHCGVIFTAITTALRLSEMEKFSCAVDTKHATHKSYVEKTCFSIYDDEYNSPVKFSAFVLFNFGSVVVVSVVYSLAVGNRIEDAERLSGGSDKPQTVARGNTEQGRKTFCVFNFYLFHLVARSMLCMLFTILQHTVLYPSGFDTQFSCVYPELRSVDPNMTPVNNRSANLSSVKCTNSAAKDKQFWLTIVSVCNLIFAVIALAEVVYLLLMRFPSVTPQSSVTWSCDWQFINKHFLRKQYVPNSCDIYKQKVLKPCLTPDINYGLNDISLDDMFIDVVIHTERAPHRFSKEMSRHEIYDVYTKIPEKSIHLKQIKDLFYANKDTNYNVPSTILVIGRPGIGKTVLTRKIMYDWAKEHNDEIYHNKVPFYFKFREFNFNEMQDITIKKFLQFGTELSEDEFESIFEEIWRNPQNAIFIFDGLDESGVSLGENYQRVLAQSKKYSNNDVSCQMSAMSFFLKILSGDMLPGATVLVTSRPTVNDVLCKMKFDRTVEIIGFTSDKIEQYVKQFCANHKRCDLEATILSHIKSSSELMNLCYIPVNCFIVCVCLFECLIDSEGDIGALPTTLTELYESALVYFNTYLDRNENKEEVLNKFQELAFNGMNNNVLIFSGKLVNEEMKQSGLLNSLPKPSFQIQIQVCFIHLTIQEFLAAKYIVETKTPEQVKEFISSHIKHDRWHLVLQFLAGLLREKMKTSPKYRSCVLMFKKYLSINEINYYWIHLDQILVMKCLRETKNENIAEEIVANSILKDATGISCSLSVEQLLSPSDAAAVVFLCKHMKDLNTLRVLGLSSSDCLLELVKLLQGRCMKSLYIVRCHLSDLCLERLGALLKSECQVNHECSKLTELNLGNNNITAAGMAHVLDNQVYNQLTDLDLSYNPIRDEGVRILSIAMQERQLKLDTLFLISCALTSESMPWLVKFLGNEHCRLRSLTLGRNAIRDEGFRDLCSVLGKETCNLTYLSVRECSLTEKCMSTLCDALDEEHCGLRYLNLADNAIGDEGLRTLCSVLGKETCNLAALNLSGCFLTKKSMSTLCGALDEEHCGLTKLDLKRNYLGDESVRELCVVLQNRTCHLTRLAISSCSLTDECMPSLCQALGDERYKLTMLDISKNGFTDKHLPLLADAVKRRGCDYVGCLCIERDNFTIEGLRLLEKASGRFQIDICG
ncbi:NACHT, LRR and PYD domains-containing protein 3-like [Dendronephthya gigantea]|uniref:NACHT, LRR and PYD domains-containing protein 3-like n=1 Tax=Dendronephthya gigantea TaxID=151771 RepID=UPI00106ADF01|nr:NACHT, LRR and PYD domains-containing protein 3-like [Dendronephthya gigantea]